MPITLTKQLTMEELKRYNLIVIHEDLKNTKNKNVDMKYIYHIPPNTKVAYYSIWRTFRKNNKDSESEKIADGEISFKDLLKKVNEKIECLRIDDMGVVTSSIYVTARLLEDVYKGHRTRAPTRKIYRKPATRKPAARKPTRK